MKKKVYFRLEYYKDTDDLSYKYRNRLFINFLRKIKKLKYVFGNIKMIESDDKIEYICYTVHNIHISINKIIKNSKGNKSIYRDFLKTVIKSVIERKKEILEEQSLSILIDTKDYNNTQLISELITQYKMINIVTSNRNQFAGLEEEAEQNFESISVLNNKRKSLRNAKYILNVDFSGEKIKEYSIDRTAIIFNVADTKIDKLMYFDGNIINNVKLIDNGEFELQDEYNIQREKWSEAVREKIEKNEYELIGNRGNVEIK